MSLQAPASFIASLEQARADEGALAAPSDEEKYEYFAVRRSWPFLVLSAVLAGTVLTLLQALLGGPAAVLAIALAVVAVPVALASLVLACTRSGADLEGHVVAVERWRKGRKVLPAVTVLVSWQDEDQRSLDAALSSAVRLQWGGRLTVHLLDHRGRAAGRDLARRHGAHYWAIEPHRSRNDGAVFSRVVQQAQGDLVLHVPPGTAVRPDLLWEAVPWTDDPSVGAVQAASTVVTKRGDRVGELAAALLRFRFRWIAPARDRRGRGLDDRGPVLYRASVLGARPPRGADPTTGGDRWRRHVQALGWRTRCLPVILSSTAAPSRLATVVEDQYRRVRDRPIGRKGLATPASSRSVARLVPYALSAAAPILLAAPLLVVLWLSPAALLPEGSYWIGAGACAAVLAVSALLGLPVLRATSQLSVVSAAHLVAVVDGALAAALTLGDRYRIRGLPTGRSAARRAGVGGLALLVLTQLALVAGVVHYLQHGGAPTALAAPGLLTTVHAVLTAPLLLAAARSTPSIEGTAELARGRDAGARRATLPGQAA